MGNSSSASSAAASPSSESASSPRQDPTEQASNVLIRDNEEREVLTDITVFGASGFVARHVCNYLVAAAAAAAASNASPSSPPESEESGKKESVLGLEEDDTDYDAIKAETTPERIASSNTNNVPPLRLTLAGRNETKLNAVLEGLKSLPEYSPSAIEIDIFVADANDEVALRTMASRSRVVLATAGPFSRYGTNVVGACASTGADYVDITAEVVWVNEMRSKFGEASAKSGSRIVSFCGFDSIPSDLVVYSAVRCLRDAKSKKSDHGQGQEGEAVPIIQAKCWHSAFGGVNGGTIETAVNAIPVDPNHMLFDDDSGKLRPVPYFVNDPFQLIDPKAKNEPSLDRWRRSTALAEWMNQVPSLDTQFGDVGAVVSCPFFMAVCNAKVVHASAYALNYYSPDQDDIEPFTYWERVFPVGFDVTRCLNVFSIIPALSYSFALAAITVTLKIPVVGQKLLDCVVPPGSGVPDWVNEMGYSHVYAEALTPSTITSSGKKSTANASGFVDRGTCMLRFQGDPGNLVTAQCVSEAALTLVYNRDALPAKSDDGFGTPAEILGDPLLSRLLESNVRKVTIETNVTMNDRRYKWERIGGVVALAGAVGYAIGWFWG